MSQQISVNTTNYAPCLVDRFERHKSHFKGQFNQMVDDLFGCLLSEVSQVIPTGTTEPPSSPAIEQPIKIENIKQEACNENQQILQNQERENGIPLQGLSSSTQRLFEDYLSPTSNQPGTLISPPSTDYLDGNGQLEDVDFEDVGEEEDCQCVECMRALECKVEIFDDDDREVKLGEDFLDPEDQVPTTKRPRIETDDQSQVQNFPLILGHDHQAHHEPTFHESIPRPASIHNYANHERRFICNLVPNCRVALPTQNLLRVHQRVHTGVRPYRCTYETCGATFTQLGAATQHVRLIHFRLPKSRKQQLELNIVDDRDPNLFVEKLDFLM